MVDLAYEKLVDAGSTDWLSELKRQLANPTRLHLESAARLKHLMIFFDSIGCYELLCESFSVAEENK
jgi:hypothetical protein